MNENFGNTPPLSPLFRILQFCTHHPHFSTHFHFSTTIHHDADAVGKTTPVSFFTSNVWLLWILLPPPNLLSCFSSKPFHFFPGKLVFACFSSLAMVLGRWRRWRWGQKTMMTENWSRVHEKAKNGSGEFASLPSEVCSHSFIISLLFLFFFTKFFQEKYRQWPSWSKWGSGGGRKRALQRGGEWRWKLWLLFAGWAEGGKK